MIQGIPLTNNSSATVQTLTLTLGGSASTTYPTATVYSYIVPPQAKTVTSAQGYIAGDPSEYRRAPEFTLLTAATKTTIGAAPPSGSVKMVTGVSIPNPDTASMTMTVAIDDNGTSRIQWRGTLLTLEALYYGNGEWYAVDANGNRKEATASNFGAITATSITLSGGSALSTYLSAVAWTPVDSSGASLSLTVVADGCIAYKIGAMVYAFVDFTFPVNASGSTINIGGLPYTCKDTTNDIAHCAIGQNGSATTMLAVVHNNTTTFGIEVVTGTAQTNVTFSAAFVRGCLIYPATS